jgi:hypothetical protein
LVIDCTTTGCRLPIWTAPTRAVTVRRREAYDIGMEELRLT